MDPKHTIVKLLPIVFSGNRYVVEADFGLEKKVPLMVHGNAGFYLMLTHEIAEELNHGQPLEKIRDYGYSARGMGRMNVERFQIGNGVFTHAENIPVFDWPEEEGKAAQGMLGIEFLTNEKVRIDFAAEQMEIGVPVTGKPDASLLESGYSHTEFFVENRKGCMNVYFDALKKEVPITVGTVAGSYSLDAVTFREYIKLEGTESKDHSPSGTTPRIYKNSAPIEYRIADRTFEIPREEAELYSFAEYGNIEQAELFPFGIFGRDWMKQHHAIVDYANQILYFK